MGEIIQKDRPNAADETSDLGSWLTANAVIASLFVAVLICLAVLSTIVRSPTQSARHDADGLQPADQGRAPTAVRSPLPDDVVGSIGSASRR